MLALAQEAEPKWCQKRFLTTKNRIKNSVRNRGRGTGRRFRIVFCVRHREAPELGEGAKWCAHEESNLNFKIRNLMSYPLNDGRVTRYNSLL